MVLGRVQAPVRLVGLEASPNLEVVVVVAVADTAEVVSVLVPVLVEEVAFPNRSSGEC